MYSDFTLNLNPEFKKKVISEVIRRVQVAEDKSKERNRRYDDFHDQLLGMTDTRQGPWDDSCQLFDPITIEHYLNTRAFLLNAIKSEPHWDVEPVEIQDKEDAQKLESYISIKSRHWNLPASLSDAISDCTELPKAIVFCGYKREFGKKRTQRYQDKSGLITDSPEEGSTPVLDLDRPLLYDGPDIRSVDPRNLTYFPPQCQDIDSAYQVNEAKLFSEEDLLLGIEQFGYDKKAVYELLGRASDEHTEFEKNTLEDQGIQIEGDVYFRCHYVIGRIPLLREGEEIETPQHLWGEDFCFLIHTASGICLKMAPSPFMMRPWVPFYLIKKPREDAGYCIPELLEVHQEEATTHLRFMIDSANITAAPVTLGPKDLERKAGGWKFKPGKYIGVDDARLIQPYPWNQNGYPINTDIRTDIRARSMEMVGAGYAEQVKSPAVPGEQPSATQVSMAGQLISSKRDLMLQSFQGSSKDGMERLGQVLVSHILKYMPPDGDVVEYQETEISITPEMLSKRYRFVPSVTHAGSPQQKYQDNLLKQQIQHVYWQDVTTKTPDKWPMAYHGARKMLEDLNERNVTAWLGPEPKMGDPAFVLQQMTMFLQQMAQTDPETFGPLLQMLSQLQQPESQMQQPMPAMFDTASLNGSMNGAQPEMAGAY